MHPRMMGGATAAAAAAALVFLVLAVFAVNPAASGATTGGPDEHTPHYNNVGAQSGDAHRAAQEVGCGVTGGCATLDTCGSDSSDADCAAPDSYVCEHQLPGLSVCESPPVASMQPCWMSGLDGALKLNQISLPGTHDTMSKGISACLQEGLANYVHTQVRVDGKSDDDSRTICGSSLPVLFAQTSERTGLGNTRKNRVHADLREMYWACDN